MKTEPTQTDDSHRLRQSASGVRSDCSHCDCQSDSVSWQCIKVRLPPAAAAVTATQISLRPHPQVCQTRGVDHQSQRHGSRKRDNHQSRRHQVPPRAHTEWTYYKTEQLSSSCMDTTESHVRRDPHLSSVCQSDCHDDSMTVTVTDRVSHINHVQRTPRPPDR